MVKTYKKNVNNEKSLTKEWKIMIRLDKSLSLHKRKFINAMELSCHLFSHTDFKRLFLLHLNIIESHPNIFSL